MHDFVEMKVVDGQQHLVEDSKCLFFSEMLLLLEVIVKLNSRYQLSHHVKVAIILVEVEYLNDVGVVLTHPTLTSYLRMSN